MNNHLDGSKVKVWLREDEILGLCVDFEALLSEKVVVDCLLVVPVDQKAALERQ